jgi:hypothetical protein
MVITGLDLGDHNTIFLLIDEKAWELVEQEACRKPRMIKQPVYISGFFDKNISSKVNVLHAACKNHAPPKTVEALYKVHPSIISEPDATYKRVALHVAIMNNAPQKTISILLKLYPDAAGMKDMHGRLPIHYACKNNVNGENYIRYLLSAYPESTKVVDANGFLPLHVACRCGASMGSIRALIRTAPETILRKTDKGSTPVHCAKQNKEGGEKQAEIIDILKEVARETKRMIAAHGPLEPCYPSRSAFKRKSIHHFSRDSRRLQDQMRLSSRSLCSSSISSL